MNSKEYLKIAQLILLSFVVMFSNISGQSTAVYKEQISLCMDEKTPDTAKFGSPPTWDDIPDSDDGRRLLVKIARSNVYIYLLGCGTEVHCFVRTLYRFGERPKYNSVCNSYTAKYIPIQRDPTAFARSASKGELRAQDETFNCTIEIFPSVFEQGQFYMETETESADGPWAKSCLEAVEYIILHELGHFEYYMYKNCKGVKLPQIGNSETDANYFATSVLRCDPPDPKDVCLPDRFRDYTCDVRDWVLRANK